MKKQKVGTEQGLDIEKFLEKIKELYKEDANQNYYRTVVEQLSEVKLGKDLLEFIRKLNDYMTQSLENNQEEENIKLYLFIIKSISMGFKQNSYEDKNLEYVYKTTCNQIIKFAGKLNEANIEGADLIYDAYANYFIVGQKYQGFPNIRIDMAARVEKQDPELLKLINEAEKKLGKASWCKKGCTLQEVKRRNNGEIMVCKTNGDKGCR